LSRKPLAPARSAAKTWLAGQHLRRQIAYQPASRYWAFQWYEAAIYLAVALAIAAFCVWWVRHRRLA
jgi:hypothetical protein